MKKILKITLFWFISLSNLSAQILYESKNGDELDPHDTIGVLNIMVNIVYDVTPYLDPCSSGGAWSPGDTNFLNSNPPDFLLDFMDTSINQPSYNGIMTRLYHESSFGRLLLIGDFVVVNISQSRIAGTGTFFSRYDLMEATINYINYKGGLSTVYSHNNLNHYDYTASGKMGEPKLNSPNNKIDCIQFLVRNKYNETGGVSGLRIYDSLLISGTKYGCDIGTYQMVGESDAWVYNPTSLVVHEFSHCLFGHNNFHTSGGNHLSNSYTNTFLGLQRGYGLMGASGSSLVSCNGYERYRLNWIHPDNSLDTAITALNSSQTLVISDIKKSDGNKSFILRDFITTDTVRWCGDIVLQEEINLKENSLISLDQNTTPIQSYRDTNSGEFSPPTTIVNQIILIVLR